MEEKNFLQKTYGILVLVAVALVILIVMGTAIALVSGSGKKSDRWRQADPEPKKVINMSRKNGSKVDAFTDLGQIRAITKPASDESNGTLLIVTPWFSYPAGDSVLLEELYQKERQEKSIIMEYISSYTAEELKAKGEKAVKEELLGLINAQLVLGKIRAVYFNDYIFFE